MKPSRLRTVPGLLVFQYLQAALADEIVFFHMDCPRHGGLVRIGETIRILSDDDVAFLQP